MKLLIENIEDAKTLTEEVNGRKELYMCGTFLQSDLRNRNGRIYPKQVMEAEVRRYVKENVERFNAYGELSHPTGPRINEDRISHLITELKEDGNNYYGKAKILDTAMGKNVRAILEGGGQLAVSSRGVGRLKESNGSMIVEAFRMSTAADVVINPSAPDAYIQAILESPDWFFDEKTGDWQMQEVEKVVAEAAQIIVAKVNEAEILKLWADFTTAITTK